MPPRRSVLAVTAAALVLSAAVGALAVEAFEGGPRPIVVPAVESGALPLLPAADEAALSWQRDAYLVAAVATEGKPLDGRVDPPLLYDTSPDPLVGNGLAVAWTFAYASPAERGRLFFATVGGDGGILYQRALADPSYGCCVALVAHEEAATADSRASTPYEEPAPRAIARIAYDAHEALARVAGHPAFAGFAADHPVFQAFLELRPGPEGRPAWSLAYRTATFYSASALVDAATGEVLRVDGWPRAEPPRPPCCEPVPPPPPPEPCCAPEDYEKELRATLGPSRPAFRFVAPVESPFHARVLRVSIASEGSLGPADALTLQVSDGAGRPLARARGVHGVEVEVRDFPTGGRYEAWLSLDRPVRDLQVRAKVEVRYDEAPRPRPAAFAFHGAVYPGSETHFPLWFAEARASAVSLSWAEGATPARMEIALLDRHGNEVWSEASSTHAPGGGERRLEADLPRDECCLILVVRDRGVGFEERPFRLEVAVEGAAVAVDHDHGHPVH